MKLSPKGLQTLEQEDVVQEESVLSSDLKGHSGLMKASSVLSLVTAATSEFMLSGTLKGL